MLCWFPSEGWGKGRRSAAFGSQMSQPSVACHVSMSLYFIKITKNQRVVEQLGLEGTCGAHLVQHPAKEGER